eukprot:846422-Pleurochrysis_carterae.AAC.3
MESGFSDLSTLSNFAFAFAFTAVLELFSGDAVINSSGDSAFAPSSPSAFACFAFFCARFFIFFCSPFEMPESLRRDCSISSSPHSMAASMAADTAALAPTPLPAALDADSAFVWLCAAGGGA